MYKMTSFKLVAIFSLLFAMLCLLALLPWTLGVPGEVRTEQQARYLEGWSTILLVMILYPISIFSVYGFNLVIWILFLYDKISKVNLMLCQQTSTIIAIAFTFLAILRVIFAFRML